MKIFWLRRATRGRTSLGTCAASCSTKHRARENCSRFAGLGRRSAVRCQDAPARGDHRPPIADLESYLIGVFHHRFNRLLRQEQRRAETIELFSSAVELEQFEGAADVEWVEQLERAIVVKQIVSRMDPWTRKVWQARQYGYAWKEVAGWLGMTEQQAKMKFHYGLEKTRQALFDCLGRESQRCRGEGDRMYFLAERDRVCKGRQV